MSNYIKFNEQYDVEQLQTELNLALNMCWTDHFNQNDYQGRWDCVSLRSRSGKENDILAFTGQQSYQNTALLQQLSYTKSIVDTMPGEKESVRFMALHPHSEIKPHKDLGCSYKDGFYRIHIPIITNPLVEFYSNADRLPLQQGECWYIDFSETHQIINNSDTVRVHLVIDGLRDEHTDTWFKANGYVQEKMAKYDEHTKKSIIEALQRMDTDTARNLIKQLKEEF